MTITTSKVRGATKKPSSAESLYAVRKEDQKQSAFTRNPQQYNEHFFLNFDYVNSPALCHNIVQRYQKHQEISQNMTLFHYTQVDQDRLRKQWLMSSKPW